MPVNEPRTVLMTADTVGGVWTYAVELIRALSPLGVRAALATMGPAATPAQRAEIRGLRNAELFESNYRLEWMDDPWGDVARAGKWLLDLESRIRPDVVHLNGYVHAALAWHAPTLIAGHSCVLSWWAAVKGAPAPPRWDRYRSLVAQGLRAADLLVAPTAAMLQCLDAHYGLPENRRVIPNARDAAVFPPGRKQGYILSAGRFWDEAKNLATLGIAAEELPWPVYVAGHSRRRNGPLPHYSNLHLLGRLSTNDLAHWLAPASIYALPARYEPFGLSVLEAALAGCALVLGDIPSLREVWGCAALYVPPDDHKSLADALRTLIKDVQLRTEMASRSRRRALTFTPRRMARAYLVAYRLLLNWRDPPLEP
jgi:glycogen(starch) synthase